MFPRKLTTTIAAGAVAIAVAIGAYAVGDSNSSDGASGTANAAPPAQSAQAPQDGQVPQADQGPQNWRPGTGTIITGAAADKAKAAALAKYPGTVNRVLKLSDGLVRRPYARHQRPAPRVRQ